MVVGNLEHQREHALLYVIQIEQSPEQERTHVRHSRAYRMSALASDIPERHWVAMPGRRFEPERPEALVQLWRQRPWNGDARHIAFDVGHEGWDTDSRQG